MRISKSRKSSKFEWVEAPDIKKRTLELVRRLDINWVDAKRVYFYRSYGSKTRAYARTWGLAKIWQSALAVGPAYIIEVISKHFDNLGEKESDSVLLHELSHIPKNFSGALLPHIRRGKRSFHKKVNDLIERYFRDLK